MQFHSICSAVSKAIKYFRGFKSFSESGAYNRGLTLKVMISEVVLTIGVVLTFERAYYRARTVRVVLIKETYSLIKHSLKIILLL